MQFSAVAQKCFRDAEKNTRCTPRGNNKTAVRGRVRVSIAAQRIYDFFSAAVVNFELLRTVELKEERRLAHNRVGFSQTSSGAA